jgi:hypothetical protein
MYPSRNRKRLWMPMWFRMMLPLRVSRSTNRRPLLQSVRRLNRNLGHRHVFPGSFRRIGKLRDLDLSHRCGGLLLTASLIAAGSRIRIGSGGLLRAIGIFGRVDLRVVPASLRSSGTGSGLRLRVGKAVVRRGVSSGRVVLAPGVRRAGRAGIVRRSSLGDPSGLLNLAVARHVAPRPGAALRGVVRRAVDLLAAVSPVRPSGHFENDLRRFPQRLSAAP